MLNPKRGAPSSTDKYLRLDLEPVVHKIVAHNIANVILALSQPIIRLYDFALSQPIIRIYDFALIQPIIRLYDFALSQPIIRLYDFALVQPIIRLYDFALSQPIIRLYDFALSQSIIRLYDFAHLEVNCSASHFINQLASSPHIPSTAKHKGLNCALRSWHAVTYFLFFSSLNQQNLRLPSVNDQGRIGHQCQSL